MSISSLQNMEYNILFKKYVISVITILCLSSGIFFPETLMAQNRYVSPVGVNAGDCSIPGSPCLTIQYAVNQAINGDNINVAAGTYNENVEINKSVTLTGTNAVVQGAPVALGTFWIPPGINNVTITGFTLLGYDSPFPGIEYAALYLQGSHNNVVISNNTITAAGEAGLLGEVGGVNTNVTIDNNIFNGVTFVGPNPGDCGFANQFTAPNVPRQLVVLGSADSNIIFTNNTISGTAGGPGTLAPCDVTGQGNTLVTIDATNVTITGNTFSGTTTRFASMLRTRGTQVSVSSNTFNGTNLQGSAFYHFYDADALTGGTPSTVDGLLASNTYLPAAAYAVSGGNTSIFFCAGPVLSTSINGVASTHTSNDGITDSLSLTMCNTADNITFNLFQDLFTPALPNVKVFQVVEFNNTSAPFCNNCATTPGAFTNFTRTISLLNNSMSGTATLKFVAFTDIDNDNVIDLTECKSDTVIYTIQVNPEVTAASIVANPTGDVCLGATGIQYSVDLTGGSSTVEYAWCAYNSGDGSGSCNGGFIPNSTAAAPTRNWTASAGPKSVGVTITQPGCPTLTDLYVFTVVTDPVRPTVNVATPATPSVCAGSGVSVTFNAGSGGTGSCADEFQYSVDNGATYLPYTPGATISAGTMTVIVQGRRVCDGPGCDGSGETFATLQTWTINQNPVINILPNPAEVCEGVGLNLNGNPSGGSGVYTTHLWSGTHADSLDNPNIQMPVFTSDNSGIFVLNYVVTDNNGCFSSASVSIEVFDNPQGNILADIYTVCPGEDLDLDGNPSGGSGVYVTHLWTGTGAASLNDVNIQAPTFSQGTPGLYNLVYTVTDDNGCSGFDIVNIDVLGTPEISATVLGTPISNPGPLLLTRQVCNTNNNVTATAITQTNASPDAFLYIEIINSLNINLAGGGPGGDLDRLDDLPLDGPLATVGSTWMNFIDDIRLQAGAQWGFVEIRITPYTDIDGSDDFNTGDCVGAQIELRFEVQPVPQVIAGYVNPTALDGEICSGETVQVNLSTNNFQMIGGGTPTPADYEYEIVQIRYSTDNGGSYPLANSGYPAGLTGGTYTVGDIISSGLAQISETLTNTTASPVYLRYQVVARLTNDPFCEDTPLNIRVVINPNPTAAISPDPAAVCAGINLGLNGNPTGGSGIYSTHSWTGPGATSLNVTNAQSVTFNNATPGSYALTYTVTDDNGCSGSDVLNVTVHENPTANITPEPAEACILTDIQLNGNPANGTTPYTHSWTGAGSPYLNNTAIVNPIFNHSVLGPYEVTYTVTDNNGCIGSDVLTINLTDTAPPVINCPAGPIVMNTDTDRCDAVVCYSVTTNDDCPFFIPDVLAGHTYLGTFNGSTYFVSNGVLSWEAANAAAAGLGGQLVNITSAQEQNYLASQVTNGPTSLFWIGLRYSRALAAYKWTSGIPFVYTKWAAGEPNLIGSHDYVFYWDANFPLVNGWHDTPASVLNVPVTMRYIIEFSGLPERLTAGLPSGSLFPLGDTDITFETEDSAGNVVECSFTVTVEDNQNPVVVCPADVTVNLMPLECEGVANYVATATDNCSVASIDYSIPSGSLFPIGITPVTATATDGSGNTAECTFNVLIFDYINPNLACKPVNISLDEICSTSIDPTIFLTGWQGPNPDDILIGCPDNFIITFMTEDGTIVPLEDLKKHIGKTLRVMVSHTMQSFTCWNIALIEDKFPPQIDCRDITVNCLDETDNLDVAFASDNCFAEPKLVYETFNVLPCEANNIGRIIRRYIAVDKFGNESEDTCTATIYLERSNFAGIVSPGNAKLQCSDNFVKDNKGFNSPAPSETGVPTYNGQPIFPVNLFNTLYCNATLDYDDVIVFDTPCKKRIARTWKIFEWHCSGLVIHPVGVPQMIDIVDDTAPVIPIVANQTMTTRTKACSATATLPALNITDNCNGVKTVNINVFNNGSPVGSLPTNGGVLELPVGNNVITYQASDNCGNTSTRTYTITVSDETNPIAICDQFTTVSIKTNGYTEVTAVAVDDGSFDECSAVTLDLQRMEDPCGTNYNIGWHEKVGFCCMDANQSRMVTLRVRDAGGRENLCMVTVNVQEKVNPTISCPADRTITDCTFTFDPNNLDFYFGAAVITDNCPANNTVNHEYDDQRNQCGVGTLIRSFEVLSGGISYGTCTQTITFQNNAPFNGNDSLQLNWPDDYTAVNQCNILNLEPEFLPAGFNRPVITQDVCDRVGFTKEDLVFPFTTNGACFKIIRKWTVIDWCQTDSNGDYKTWTHEQEIKVMDNTAPLITSPDTSRLALSYDANCLGANIVLTASAEDCTPEEELSWNYTVLDAAGNFYDEGNTNDASGYFPIGDYTIEFVVEDRCGNQATTGYTFEIINAKTATPICFNDLSADLVVMDLDNNGTPDTAMVDIKAERFNNHSYHSCYPNDPLIFSFSPDVNDTVRTFGCTDIGLQPITMYVTDINGNQAYCSTHILITNNDTTYTCTGNIVSGAIYGRVATENNQAIQEVSVKLDGTELDTQMTGETGEYNFGELPLGGNYGVTPSKDVDHDNGVSTLDIVMIQRHILGIEKLPSTYKYLAADVNNDQKINSLDLVELRKIVLGTQMTFKNNTSWRFVEENFEFLDPSSPLQLFIPGMCAIANLQQEMKANFIGIKIGDVNGSAKLDEADRDEAESRHYFAFKAENKFVKAGQKITIPVMSNSNATLYGWQQKIVVENATLLSVESNMIDQLSTSIHISGNEAGLSIALGEGQVVQSNQELFYLTIVATQDGFVKDMVSYQAEGIHAEVYVDGLQTAKTMKWQWVDVAETTFDIVKHQPNPWKESTIVGFTIPQENMVTVKIKDQTGRTVYSATEYYMAGEQQIEITREAIQTSGLYFIEVKYNQEVKTVKTIMID